MEGIAFANALLVAADEVRENAYAPYSHYAVGAALLGKNGQVYTGCNVESIAYPAGVCAERMALGAAVADGCREFVMLAVSGGPQGLPPAPSCTPCGVCRQLLAEFAPLTVVTRGEEGQVHLFTMQELLPASFSAEDLQA